MSTIERLDIAFEIESGRYDGDLKEIEAALAVRKNEMLGAWRSALKPGFRVRLIDRISPQYLAGHTGTVERVEGKRFVVKFDYPAYGRSRTWRTANCYPQHLEPHED